MNLSDFMREEFILLDLLSTVKEAVVKELISPLIENGIATSEEALVKTILDREKLGSTAIGDGVAIPHARNSCVKEKAIIFGRTQKGVNFSSIDNKPVYLFFLIVSPDSEAGPHLKMLARISRLLQDSDFRESLLTLPIPHEIIEYIKTQEAKSI